MVVLEVWSPLSTFLVKSTVSNLEHVGHEACPNESKQALQKTCSQEVTCNNEQKLLDGKKIQDLV